MESLHSTQRPTGRSQSGVDPEQWALSKHCTQVRELIWHWIGATQSSASPSPSHCKQAPTLASHDSLLPVQSEVVVQLCRHLLVVGSQILPRPQSAVALHATQR